MAIADVFTALTEPRPYREPADSKTVSDIMRRMATDQKLDAKLVELFCDEFPAMDHHRQTAQRSEQSDLESFWRSAAPALEIDETVWV